VPVIRAIDETYYYYRQKSRGLHGVLPEGRLISSDFF
jgi:hypothetical protein